MGDMTLRNYLVGDQNQHAVVGWPVVGEETAAPAVAEWSDQAAVHHLSLDASLLCKFYLDTQGTATWSQLLMISVPQPTLKHP